jgi:hypothetical protein
MEIDDLDMPPDVVLAWAKSGDTRVQRPALTWL